MASSRIGAPVLSSRNATPRNFSSGSAPANLRDSDSPWKGRMFTAKYPARRMHSWESACFSTHTRTRRGSSDTELNALTVSPHGVPVSGSRVVTTATPVAKCPMVRRNSAASIPGPVRYRPISVIVVARSFPHPSARSWSQSGRAGPEVFLAVADRVEEPVPACIRERERRGLGEDPAADLVGALDRLLRGGGLHAHQPEEGVPPGGRPEPQVPRIDRREAPRTRPEHTRPLARPQGENRARVVAVEEARAVALHDADRPRAPGQLLRQGEAAVDEEPAVVGRAAPARGE